MNDEQAKAFYKSWAWKKCRELILKRDNYLCQMCLKNGLITAAKIVHHIIHLKDNPLLALEEDNLTSVCNTCHERLHPSRGQENNKTINQKITVYEVNGNDNII